MVNFGEHLKTFSLRSDSATRMVIFKRTKIGGKYQNSNETFWMTFKHCVFCDFDIYFTFIFMVYNKRKQAIDMRTLSSFKVLTSIFINKNALLYLVFNTVEVKSITVCCMVCFCYYCHNALYL